MSEARWHDLEDHVGRIQQLAEILAQELRQLVNELRHSSPEQTSQQDNNL
jgi:signal transduction histidine kinase